MLLAWMGYAVLFGVITYAAALAADRIAATWGWGQRFIWLAALMVVIASPAFFATRPRVTVASAAVESLAPELDVPISSGSAAPSVQPRESMRDRAARIVREADPFLIRVWLFASAAWVLLLVRAAIGVRRRRTHWRAVEIDGIAVLVSPAVGPAVVGALAPRVVIPQWALSLDAPARALMLRHEREHIRARDPLLLLAAALATTFAPWNAALWLIVRRLRLAIEIDCDRRVLRASEQRREYGELLLTVGARQSAPLPFATSLAERRPFLERRIRAMTTTSPRYPRLVSAACIVLAAVASTAAVRAPRPNSLVTQSVPAAAAPLAPATTPTPTVAPITSTPVPTTKASAPASPKPAPTVHPVPLTDLPTVQLPTLEVPRVRRGPDSLSVEEIRALISAHHPSALNGDPDINTITLVVDAHNNYVTSLAESRPFTMVRGRGRSGGGGVGGGGAFGAGGGAGGGVIYARGGAGGNVMPATAPDTEKIARMKALLDSLKTRMAQRSMAGDTVTVDIRSNAVPAELVARVKAELDRSHTLGEAMGLNMQALSQVIDPETMESTRLRMFEPGQLGTTALRVFVVRLKP